MNYIKTYKICLLAGEDVGKKTLMRNYLTQLFKEDITMTLGVEFNLLEVEVHGKRIKLQFWIFSDEERFQFQWNYYIIGANGVILMYDITNAKILSVVSEWIQMIKNVIKYDVPILLVGNKLDLEGNREVSKDQVELFKENNGISESIEISLQTGENVEKMLMTFIGMIEREIIDEKDFSLEPSSKPVIYGSQDSRIKKFPKEPSLIDALLLILLVSFIGTLLYIVLHFIFF